MTNLFKTTTDDISPHSNRESKPLSVDDFNAALEKMKSGGKEFHPDPPRDILPPPQYEGETIVSVLQIEYAAVLNDSGILAWESKGLTEIGKDAYMLLWGMIE